MFIFIGKRISENYAIITILLELFFFQFHFRLIAEFFNFLFYQINTILYYYALAAGIIMEENEFIFTLNYTFGFLIQTP